MTTAVDARLLDGTATAPAGLVDAPRGHVRRHHPAPLSSTARRSRASSQSGPITTSSVAAARSAATRSGASGSTASSTRSASTTARCAPPRSRPDMNTPITTAGHGPAERARQPHRDRRARPGRAGWGAATDNVGVARYNVHRSHHRRLHAERPRTAIAQPTGTSYTDTGLAAGTYYYKVTAEDAAGNVGPASNEASATPTADTTPPTAPRALGDRRPGQVALTWTALDRRGRHRALQRPPSTTAGLHAGARRTGSRSRRARRTRTAPSRRDVPTTTASPPRTTPGNISTASERGERARSRSGRRPGSSAPSASTTGQRHGRRRPIRQRATTARSPTRPGQRGAGKFGNALSFNGVNASSPSPTRTRST